ncbi:MAG: nucleoside 2-deoxyribosyltransferase [Candidatus Gastranaerophilales bacterium]|nr:nucleoside 2-deoxyribosyltransferase [Candidatus Gastranaerophilales bacterium]
MNRSVYLAGAMSCYFNTKRHDYPKQWREDVKQYVKEHYEGINIISPTDFYEVGKNDHKSESEVIRFDLRMVRESDVVLVNLRDLDKSLGTSDEIFYAFIKGKPIIGFLEDEEEYKNIHPWKIEQIDRIETGKRAIKNALEYIYSYYVDKEY